MMTRKDYVATADILNKFKEDLDPVTFEDLVDEFADMFAMDNERFQADRFKEAAGLGE
jgi:hypothetical protein